MTQVKEEFSIRNQEVAPGFAQMQTGNFGLERTADKRRASDDDPRQALTLAGELGYLALALEQAAAFMRRRALTFAEYRRRWQRADQKVLQWHDPRTMQYERPLATTWQASIEGLPPQARSLLDLLAWLAPAPLPRFLFDHAAAPEGSGHLFEDTQNPRKILGALCGEAEADPEEALAALRDFSLLQPSAEAEFPSEGQVHRVLALITRERQEGEARSAALKAAVALVNAAAVGDPSDVRTWPIWEPLQPHARALVDHAESAGIPAPTARLLNDLALLLKTKARHVEAEPLYRRALAIDEASLGPEHPEVAIRLNNLAGLLRATNRPAEAEPPYRRALAIDEASFGPEHPNVAIRLNNLAQLLQATNRPGEAEPLLRRALVILLQFTRDTGHHHPHVQALFVNYWELLGAMALAEEELGRRIVDLGAEAGFGEEDFRQLLDGL